jgi:hypothetical protein
MYNMPDIRRILETPVAVKDVQKSSGLMRKTAEDIVQRSPDPRDAILSRIRKYQETANLPPEEESTTGALDQVMRPVSRGDTATDVGKKLLEDLMSDFNLTREQAAGFVGNLDHETGGFKFMQEIKPVVPGSRGGYGFAQWTASRRVAFESWAAERNLPLDSYEANYGYLKHELENTPEGSVLKDLKAAKGVEEAATIVSEKFLRPGTPNLGSRTFRASSYFEGQ